jgi:MFS family permease
MQRNYWVAVICGAIILTIGVGTRGSFGIFMKPVAAEFNNARELWSFGTSLAMLLMGAFSPFVGGIADRFGAARTIAAGGALYVIGMLVIWAGSSAVMITFGNILTGIGLSAAGFGPIFGVIGRATPASERSFALGVATAGGSFGQFAIVPLAAALMSGSGQDWRFTMLVLAILSVAMVPLTLGLRETRASLASAAGPRPQSWNEALSEASKTPGFWLLTVGFFVCGFHVAFVGLHLPAYISDKGVGLEIFGRTVSPSELGGWAIGLVGLFNIVGSLLWGWLGGRHRRKDMLALLYALRAAVFILFLILPLSATSVLVFAALLGFLWLGTIPLTSGLVGYIFGPAYMSMLYGIVFFSHQLGSFVGGWGGGRLFDLTESYDAMWWISVALGLTAALLNFVIREKPVARLAPAAAQ